MTTSNNIDSMDSFNKTENHQKVEDTITSPGFWTLIVDTDEMQNIRKVFGCILF
jgi:hypothetical protein